MTYSEWMEAQNEMEQALAEDPELAAEFARPFDEVVELEEAA